MTKNSHTPLDFAIAGINIFYGEAFYSDHDFYPYHFICPCESIAEILERHMKKVKIANSYVSKKIIRSNSSNFTISNFQKECEEEIASMKSEKFSNSNVSFYDILTKDTSQLAMYAGNESIIQILRSDIIK